LRSGWLWAEAIERIRRGYWSLREGVGLPLAIVVAILLLVLEFDRALRLIIPT
jgi:hypothetical protein